MPTVGIVKAKVTHVEFFTNSFNQNKLYLGRDYHTYHKVL
jgi:hypothetical protein